MLFKWPNILAILIFLAGISGFGLSPFTGADIILDGKDNVVEVARDDDDDDEASFW